MSMVGAQEQLSEDHSGEAWELLGRDMIRTRDGRQIVAQFWTSPSATDASLIAAAPDLLAALKAMVLNDRHAYRDCHKAAVAALAKAGVA